MTTSAENAKDIRTYRQLLPIDKHRLDDALEIQADTQERISERLAVMSARVEAAADELKREEGRAFMSAKEGGASDKLAEVKAREDAQRNAYWIRWSTTRKEFEEWRGLLESWKARGFSLKELVALYAAKYFAINQDHAVGRSSRHEMSSNADPRPAYSPERIVTRQHVPDTVTPVGRSRK